MIKYTAFVLIVAVRIMYHPASDAQSVIAPFASNAPLSTATISVVPAKMISIAGSISNHTVVLNWVVGDNETADQFEVEKSSDGKNFTMAALVFGTDKSETGNYQFYEKAGKQKIIYRIKLINKNRQTEYSEVVVINPTV